MTNDGKPVCCWDASVFLALINEETGAQLQLLAAHPADIRAIQCVVRGDAPPRGILS